jgi:hypothetical protein
VIRQVGCAPSSKLVDHNSQVSQIFGADADRIVELQCKGLLWVPLGVPAQRRGMGVRDMLRVCGGGAVPLRVPAQWCGGAGVRHVVHQCWHATAAKGSGLCKCARVR